MDVATHLLVPYAAAIWVLGRARPGWDDRTRAGVAAAFGLGGAAPDLDGLLDGLSEAFPSLFWLQHRGVSHSLAGAPVFGLAFLVLLALVARRWPARFGLFQARPALFVAAGLGAWTHLLLDMITLAGVPLWFPFAYGRAGHHLFGWLVWWLFPFGAVVLGLHAWGKLDRRRVGQAGALVVAILVVLGAARAAWRPDAPEGGHVFPRASPFEWIVAEPGPDGSWTLTLWRGSQPLSAMRFDAHRPAEAEEAITLAQATYAHRGFLLGSYGPILVQAHPHEAGGWTVTFLDVAQRFEALHDPPWAPVEPYDEWGYVRFHVRDNEITTLHGGW